MSSMELNPFQLFVVTGIFPIVFQAVPRKYHLIQDLKNWTDAQTYCRLNFVDLATVENSSDMESLEAEAQQNNYASKAWVGLYSDVNSWRWSLNDAPLGFKSWGGGEPNNGKGKLNEECAKIDTQGLWYDAACTQENYFLCYNAKNPITSKYLRISDAKRSWKDSQAYCRQYHTDLASARGIAENTALQIKVQTSTVWFGLYRDSWKWSDKTEVSTVLWKSTPDNSGGYDNCASMKDGLLTDESCSLQHAFFCHSYPMIKKRLIRVKVQSSQDPNDPVVKAEILEKIQQKLKEQGLADNTTLTFRVQPHGMVFYKKEENENVTNSTTEVCDL